MSQPKIPLGLVSPDLTHPLEVEHVPDMLDPRSSDQHTLNFVAKKAVKIDIHDPLAF
jgi:hypothetical protein